MFSTKEAIHIKLSLPSIRQTSITDDFSESEE